jgi:glycosyltransferase involved in cell wall biosynthesis
MRIGLIITNRVPLKIPEGMIFASIPFHLDIAAELAKRGHAVTIFCSEDSIVSPPMIKAGCGLISSYALQNTYGKKLTAKYDTSSVQLHYSAAYEKAGQLCDIVWSHDAPQLSHFAPFVHIPTVFTLHDPLDRPEYSLLNHYSPYGNQWNVSISNAQRIPLPDLKYAETIYHGIDISNIPFNDAPESFAVFFGRIIPEKGVLESISVAKKAGIPIKLIGPLGFENPIKKAYSEEVLRQVDGNDVEYLGTMDREPLLAMVSRASVFINMIDVRESFGLVLIESMATGTPVVCRNRGAASEVIKDGETGYVIENEDEAVVAVKKISSIARSLCRQRVEENFSLLTCASRYEALFEKVIADYGARFI